LECAKTSDFSHLWLLFAASADGLFLSQLTNTPHKEQNEEVVQKSKGEGRNTDRTHKAKHFAIAKPKHAPRIVAQLDLYTYVHTYVYACVG